MVKTLRQYIKELEQLASKHGDDLPVLLKFTPLYISYCPIYRDIKVRVENLRLLLL